MITNLIIKAKLRERNEKGSKNEKKKSILIEIIA